jgi:hypothetical protein
MTSETTTSYLDVVLCTLYILTEAVYFLHYSRSTQYDIALHDKMKSQRGAVDEWKSELASHGKKGASSVNAWVNGWFDSLDQSGPRGDSQDVKRGNVETYLSGSYLASCPPRVLTNRTSLRTRPQRGPR